MRPKSNKKRVEHKEKNVPSNDKMALYLEGVNYFQAKNYKQALHYFNLAAELNHAEAWFYLAHMYSEGVEVKKDDKKGLQYYKTAFKLGNHHAAYKAAHHLQYQEYDYSQAMLWYRKAAEQFHPTALFEIAGLYYNGYGVDQDYQQALSWYKKAATEECEEAEFAIGNMYLDGIGVNQDSKQAFIHFQSAAKMRYEPVYYRLGVMFRDGAGVQKNYKEAIKWLKLAVAETRNEEDKCNAECDIGCIYFEGSYGIEQDWSEAMIWLKKAAQPKDNAKAAYHLGIMYRDGLGIKQDYKEALFYFTLSARLGFGEAMYAVGEVNEDGLGIKQDMRKAFLCYKRAVEKGSTAAQVKLGIFYRDGLEGAPQKDLSQALYWFQQVLESSNDEKWIERANRELNLICPEH